MSLTHTDQNGHAHMVDVSAKTDSARVARASGRVRAARSRRRRSAGS